MKPLKPWRSFEDQLQQLQARGLQVENHAAVLDYLERVGYYRLSGYWYLLRQIDEAASLAQGEAVRLDSFIPGSRFEDVALLYVFDKKLRLLALDALERIEMAVRVNVAHSSIRSRMKSRCACMAISTAPSKRGRTRAKRRIRFG